MTDVRTDAMDTFGVLTLKIQLDGLRGARVPSHSGHTHMVLACDMSARRAFDRLTQGVRTHGAAAQRAGANYRRRLGARTGSDGSDGVARTSQVGSASV